MDAQGRPIAALFAATGAPVQLDFSKGRLAVSNTCNQMAGSYREQQGRLEIPPLASTLMACADPRRAALDQAVSGRLQGTLGLGLQGPDTPGMPARLTLTTADGSVLGFTGRPTAATRYDGPAERIYLEVAADTAPCTDGAQAQQPCLQVRRVRYDDQGLRLGRPLPFALFSAPIEGYQHQPGVRNVLRVDRYSRAGAPADTDAQAYVLDKVVESEIVRP